MTTLTDQYRAAALGVIPPVVIAEMAQCHDGYLDRAITIAKAAADAGCWGIKVQLITPDRLSHPDAVGYATADAGKRQIDMWEQNGLLTVDELEHLRGWCAVRGLAFVATPFDHDSITLATHLGVDAVKIASGDITNHWLINDAAALAEIARVPLIISTGAATFPEIGAALSAIETNPNVTIMACNLTYPHSPWQAYVGRVRDLTAFARERLAVNVSVGYSCHVHRSSAHTIASLATAAGAHAIEVHATYDPATTSTAVGPAGDHAFAVRPEQLEQVVSATKFAWTASQSTWGEVLDSERPARDGARRSLYAVRDLDDGTSIERGDVIALRPYQPDGYAPCDFDRFLAGKRIVGTLSAGTLITQHDIN